MALVAGGDDEAGGLRHLHPEHHDQCGELGAARRTPR